MPAPTAQFFTGRMPFLPPNQQCQSTEGIKRLDQQHEIARDRDVVSSRDCLETETSRLRPHPWMYAAAQKQRDKPVASHLELVGAPEGGRAVRTLVRSGVGVDAHMARQIARRLEALGAAVALVRPTCAVNVAQVRAQLVRPTETVTTQRARDRLVGHVDAAHVSTQIARPPERLNTT